jgi:hypothetical protein
VQHEAEVDELVKPEDGAEALTKHVYTIGDALLDCGLALLLAVDVVECAVRGGHALHPTQPHAELSIVGDDLDV